MKHSATIGVCLLVAGLVLSSVCFAQNFPGPPSQSGPAQGPAGQSVQQQIYYGYVPPPPIRHTWPGGYRTIFHELIQTLANHITGHY
jgi:hypothetical protein